MVRESEARGDGLPVEATSLRAPAGAARVASWVRARIEDFAEHGHLHSSAEGAPDHHHDHVH